ncbi:MAG: methyltransferase domain-containing protein, partial [Acidimicrobiales bacterium]
MNILKLYSAIFRITGTRKKRMKLFNEIMGPMSEHRILDIGGTPLNWEYLEVTPKITLVNKNAASQDQQTIPAGMELVEGDATGLQYGDTEFDIAFSNSVIEHLYTRENQVTFALEAERVAKRVWIQTPARGFFLAPHLITPFVH